MSESPLAEKLTQLRTPDGTALVLAELLGPQRGEGPSVLLLHGLAQTRRTFELGPLPRLLVERGARVFLGELRGHGRSWSGPPIHTLEVYLTQDLPTILEAIPGPVHLLGHSLGGLLGYAALGEPYHGRLASLTGLAAPLTLAAGRWDIRLLAHLVRPVIGQLDAVPLDRLLAGLARPLAQPHPLLSVLQRYVGLTNPQQAAPSALEATLVTAHPEAPAVFAALLEMATSGRPVLLGRDLRALAAAASIPVAAIVGERDVFAAPRSVAGLEEGVGRRWVHVVPAGAHVDLTLGHHWEETFPRWWSFLFEP